MGKLLKSAWARIRVLSTWVLDQLILGWLKPSGSTPQEKGKGDE